MRTISASNRFNIFRIDSMRPKGDHLGFSSWTKVQTIERYFSRQLPVLVKSWFSSKKGSCLGSETQRPQAFLLPILTIGTKCLHNPDHLMDVVRNQSPRAADAQLTSVEKETCND